jgi:HJR/Mrr/RecB family endonuclease
MIIVALILLPVAICICVEQSFTEASAQKTAFRPAFSAAMDAYLASTLQEDANRKIAGLSDLLDKEDPQEVAAKIIEIIKAHPLRIFLSFEFQDFRAHYCLGIHFSKG